MSKRKKKQTILENILITSIAAEGKSLARVTIPAHDGTPETQLVVFVPWCIPGDVVDIRITRKKHNYAEGEAIRFHKYGEKRIQPVCSHFGVCGGCKWQQLPYEEQLQAKQQQVYEQLSRIGHLSIPQPGTASESGCHFYPIMGSVKTFEYRNKLDFGCSNKRYLTREDIASLPPSSASESDKMLSAKNHPSIGFHVGGAFDKILPIEKCYLMDDLHNSIRNFIHNYALNNDISFFDLRQQTGLLRDVIIRNSNSGEWMVIIQFKFGDDNNPDRNGSTNDREKAQCLMQAVADRFPEITSLLYVDNQKCNDTIGDLTVNVFKGKDYITELMEDLQFKVGAKSFYQTNTEQAYHLYSVVRQMAFDNTIPSRNSQTTNTSKPLVYDLYTGTGTIANFVAAEASKVVGIEYVPEAIEDAKVNSEINNISNTLFFAGDMKDILSEEFLQTHGTPDVIITDPPRAGMHSDVVKTILKARPRRIVYVSCNPATQARDLAELVADYEIKQIQPVDMFPHTPHVENVVLLERK